MSLPWRKVSLVALDALLLTASYFFAFWARLGGEGLAKQWEVISNTLPIILSISLYVHLRTGLFNAILRYASIDTALAVLKAVVISVLLSCLVLFLIFRLEGLPRSIFIIHAMAALILVGGARIGVRVVRRGTQRDPGCKRILLYGAGDTADLVLRGFGASRTLGYAAVGLIDDDPKHAGQQLHGVAVLGGFEKIADSARNLSVDEIWVCVPDLVGEPLRKVYSAATSARVAVKILPRLEHAFLGADLQKLHSPDIADLLRRPPRRLDRERMQTWLKGRKVLITGAGGSIGSELVRQVLQFGPAEIALCDSNEERLFQINNEVCALRLGAACQPFLLDVRDPGMVAAMFREFKPDVVFHAAAYKHVPLVELNPCEAILNNVQGLQTVSLAALEHGVKEFVSISTDKAVRPVNVMGATKRLGEKIVQVLNRQGKTRFMAVRFGNVLGSSGSVVPIFQAQIQKGGPVTVTHPEMTRYFMLISEAVELVIQAGSIGRGGEIFILDMGKPVRILDMAHDLIRLMGKEPERDIKVEFTGIRPGERLYEELLVSPKDAQTPFPDIWIDHEPPADLEWSTLGKELETVFKPARLGNRRDALLSLKKLVPEFAPGYASTRASMGEEPSASASDPHSSSAPAKRRVPQT